MLTISVWIDLEDEVDSEQRIPQSKDDEARRPESKVLVRSILTATFVASVKASKRTE